MQGVVFDFDGVIARSMALHAEAYQRVLEPLGIPVDKREVLRMEGARSETIIADFAAQAGVRVDAKALADQKQRVFQELGPVALYPGAEDVVRRAAKRVPVGLVTGTRRSNLEALIPQLMDRFTVVLAQADYTKDKPDPEPYAKAAKALGIAPGHLVCVENASRGVESARAAGYGHIVAITTTLAAADLAHADTVVADHAALDAELRRLLA